MVSVAEVIAAHQRGQQARDERASEPHRARAKRFYASFVWRRLRYRVLADNAIRNGGTARCELCGTTAAAGAPLNVDHIKPLSKHWELRLARDNCQVLCGPCNHGKLNRDDHDWRPAESAD